MSSEDAETRRRTPRLLVSADACGGRPPLSAEISRAASSVARAKHKRNHRGRGVRGEVFAHKNSPLLANAPAFGLRHVSHNVRIIVEISRHRRYCSEFQPSFVQPDYMRHFFDLNVVVASRTSPLPVNVLNCHRVSPEGGWQIRTNLTGAAQRRMAHLIFHLPLARFVIQQF